jgi:hypothetical protein
MSQTAKPDITATGNTRANNDVGHITKRPAGNPRAAIGAGPFDSALTEDRPLQDEWEWRMQSREGAIRFRTGPDDPRLA